MARRILITVGGTGGHIYPAIALAKQLKERYSDLYVAFAGGGLGKNVFFDRQAFPYHEVSCGYFPLRRPFKCLQSLGKILKGVWQSGRLIKSCKPDIIVGFGSYHSLPILLSAKLHSIPFLLHEANIVPGKVNRLLSKYALATGIHFPLTSQHINGKTVSVGMPLRKEMVKGSCERDDSYRYFNLSPQRNTVLIFGGSQGAFAINRLMAKVIEYCSCDTLNIQILHFSGDRAETESMRRIYEKHNVAACVKDSEVHMERAWTVADIVIGRAGAGTIAEQLEFEVPGILIPYPHAADDHQNENAQYMVKSIGGSLMHLENELDPIVIAKEIHTLLDGQTGYLDKMQRAMAAYKENLEKHDLCSLINTLIPS